MLMGILPTFFEKCSLKLLVSLYVSLCRHKSLETFKKKALTGYLLSLANLINAALSSTVGLVLSITTYFFS